MSRDRLPASWLVVAGIALALPGCETLSPDPPLATAYPRTVAEGARPDAIEAAVAAGRSPLVAAYGVQAALDPYVNLLGTLSWHNRRCHAFFETRQRAYAKQRFAQDEIGLGAGTAAAAAALAGASANVLAGLGIGTSFVQGSISNYAEASFLEPEPAIVYALVKRAHVAYLETKTPSLEEIENVDLDDPRSKAVAIVVAFDLADGYAQICTRESIARLVTKALEEGDVTAAVPGEARRGDEKRIAVEFVRQATGRPVTAEQAGLVYWIVVARQRTLDEPQRTAVGAFLGPDLLAKTLEDETLANVLSVDLVARNLAPEGGALWNRLTAPPAASADPDGTPAVPQPSPSFLSAAPAPSDADVFADQVYGPGSLPRRAVPPADPVSVTRRRSGIGIPKPTLLDVR